jgi:hypothetical protein
MQVWYSVCSSVYRTHCSTYQTAYTDARTTHYTVPVRSTVFPEDEPSGSKYMEDIKRLKLIILI